MFNHTTITVTSHDYETEVELNGFFFAIIGRCGSLGGVGNTDLLAFASVG